MVWLLDILLYASEGMYVLFSVAKLLFYCYMCKCGFKIYVQRLGAVRIARILYNVRKTPEYTEEKLHGCVRPSSDGLGRFFINGLQTSFAE